MSAPHRIEDSPRRLERLWFLRHEHRTQHRGGLLGLVPRTDDALAHPVVRTLESLGHASLQLTLLANLRLRRLLSSALLEALVAQLDAPQQACELVVRQPIVPVSEHGLELGLIDRAALIQVEPLHDLLDEIIGRVLADLVQRGL